MDREEKLAEIEKDMAERGFPTWEIADTLANFEAEENS